jgi:hypothetical protein
MKLAMPTVCSSVAYLLARLQAVNMGNELLDSLSWSNICLTASVQRQHFEEMQGGGHAGVKLQM